MCMCLLALVSGGAGAWWGDAYRTPSLGGAWSTATSCGTFWYTWTHNTSCTAQNKSATFNPGFVWNGRGYIYMDWVQTGSSYADAGVRLRYRNQDGGLTGQYSEVNECGSSCAWIRVLNGETNNMYDWNGIELNGNESWTTGCQNVCGYGTTSAREIHMWGDKWVYMNDWIVFGGFGVGGNVSEVSWSPPFGESGVYVYGALDTSHGNYFANNLYGGKTPARVHTGDCGNAGMGNYLNFKGNANVGGVGACDNCTAYAFAWVYTPGGAGPQWGVGSDDGVRIWENGTLIWDNNASRGVVWENDRFTPAGMSAGWNRVLFKVRNGVGGFGGVISLHHGTDFNQMEPSVSLQGDRYGGFSVGYEQNDWYPRIDVASCYGLNNPQPNDNVYGNNTTVTASGTASVTGPVPLWKVMHWEWGYGISETNYADVSSGTGTWSHSQTGVTGHRRFHFFSVSRSGRTSRQNSGSSGGDTWQDGGYGNYIDVYVDNVAPVNPSFSSASAASASQINLGWALPLDQGVGTAAGATEAAEEGGGNTYRRGDVGVAVYRNGSAVYGWGTGTSTSDTGLTANTQYTYTIAARDNTSQYRGAWANSTGQQGSIGKYTLIETPVGVALSNVTLTSMDAAPTGTLSNLASGSSGVRITNATATNNSGWEQDASGYVSSGLTPNAQYSFVARARNGEGIETADSAAAARYTLAKAGIWDGSNGNVQCTDAVTGTWYPAGKKFGFSNPAGFGASTHGGSVWKASSFEYKWTQSATEGWSSAGTAWNSSTIEMTPTEDGDWYLHVRALNGDGVANNTNTVSYGPFKYDGTAPTGINAAGWVSGSASFSDGKVTLNWTNGSFSDPTPGSGLASLPLAVYDGATNKSGDLAASETDFEILESGVGGHTYTLKLKDNVGNVAAGPSLTVQVPGSAENPWIYTGTNPSLSPPGIYPTNPTKVLTGFNSHNIHGMASGSTPDGAMMWTPFTTGGSVQGRVPIGYFPDTTFKAFAGSQDNFVYCINASDGAAFWQHDMGAGNKVLRSCAAQFNVAVTVPGKEGTYNLVFAGSGNYSSPSNFLRAINASNGQAVWTFSPGNMGAICGGPAVVPSTNTVYFTSMKAGTGHSLWAINTTNGALRWSRDIGDSDYSVSTNSTGSVIYAADINGKLYAYDSAGNKKWEFTMDAGYDVLGAPAFAAGKLYVATANNKLWCIVDNGSSASVNTAWPGDVLTDGWVSITTPSQPVPVVNYYNAVYVGSGDGKLYELSMTNGAVNDYRDLGSTVGDPTVDPSRIRIYAGTSAGRVHAFSIPF